MAAPHGAAGAAAEPTPMTPRPVVTDEKGYHYRWDISVGDTPSDLDWGDEIVKKDKKLSFEKDVRVQEFDKKRPSDEIVNLQRKPETKQQAELPDTVHQEVLKRKKRKKKKKKKRRRRPRKKYRFELGKPIKRDDDDDTGAGDDKSKKKRKKSKKKKSKKKKSKKKRSKKKGKKKSKKKKKESATAAPTPPAPPATAPVAPGPPPALQPPEGPGAKTGEQGPAPLPSTGLPDGMIMITHERSSSSSSGPFTERVRMVASPGTFNRLSSREPPTLEPLLSVGGEPGAPGQQLLWQALPQQQPPLPDAQRAALEPGTTEQVLQAGPGGAQIKIRTKTEIEMIPPEEEPPPPPRRGIEAITRQEIAEHPSPDGGEPLYTTSQDNVIRRYVEPGRTSSRSLRRVLIPGTEGLSLSPHSRVIRTTTRKVQGPDGAPRMDTKVDISPPRQAAVHAVAPPRRVVAPQKVLLAPTLGVSKGSRSSTSCEHRRQGTEADVRYETQLLHQLSDMVRDRTERELGRAKRRERRERRKNERRERRRSSRVRRSRRRRRSTGDVPHGPSAASIVFAQRQASFDGKNAFLEPIRSPFLEPRDVVPAASVANALEQCCRMLENVADEFRAPPEPPFGAAGRRSNRRSHPARRSGDSCLTTVSSWLGLSGEVGGTRPARRGGRRSGQSRKRRRSSSTRASSSRRRSSTAGGSSSRSSSSRRTSSSRSGGSRRSSSSTGRRRRRCRRRSRTSTASSGKRFSKEFEFVTHITSKGQRPQESQKLVIVGRASEETIVSTAGRAAIETYQKCVAEPRLEAWHDRVGDWDDRRPHDVGPRPDREDRIDDRGDDRAEDGDYAQGRGRHGRGSGSRGSWRSSTVGCSDDVLPVKRVYSRTRVALTSPKTGPAVARHATPADFAQFPTRDVVDRAFSAARVTEQSSVDLPVQEEIRVSIQVEPQGYVLPSVPMQPHLRTLQTRQSPVAAQFRAPAQTTYDHAPVQGSLYSSETSAVAYSSLVESAVSGAVPSQLPSAQAACEVRAQALLSQQPQYASPCLYVAPEHRHPTFPHFALAGHDCGGASSYGEQHVQIVIEGDACPDPRPLHVDETPVIASRPASQFLQHEEPSREPLLLLPRPTAASPVRLVPAPLLTAPPEYAVYSSPYGVLYGQPRADLRVHAGEASNCAAFPCLPPTASAPVLVRSSRTYTDEESSGTDGSDGDGQLGTEGAAAGRAASLAPGAAAWATLPRTAATTDVLKRKPAAFEGRALRARGLEAKSSKLHLGQAVRTYDQWMANQARYQAMREARRTSYQTHVIIAFLLLVATLIGVMALISVYGKKHFMSLFGDYDSEYNQTMNSPWLKYFLRSFHFNGSANGSKEEMFGLCGTPECRAEGLFISQTLNWTVNPCDDFYSFVCSDWANRAYPASADQVVVGDIEDALLKYLTEDSIDEDDLVAPAKRLFDECVNLSAIQALRLEPLRAVMEKTGLSGWPLESDENRSSADVWSASAKILRHLGLPTFLSVRLTKVSRTSDAVVVLDRTDAFGDIGELRDNVSASRRSWRLLQKMRAVNTDVPLGLAEEVLELMRYVGRLAAASSSRDGEEVRSLGDLNLFQPFVAEATAGALPNADPVVLLQSSDYVSDLVELVRVTPPHVSLNYLGHVLTDHLALLAGLEETPGEDRARACLRTVERALPRMVHYAAYLRFRPALEHLSVRNMVDDLKHELMIAIAKIAWMDVATKSQVLRRLTETQVRAFFPHWMSSGQLAREAFAGVPAVLAGQALLSYQAVREHQFAASLAEPADADDLWRGGVFDAGCTLDRDSAYLPMSLLNVTGRTTQFFLLFQIPRLGVRLAGCLLRAALGGGLARWSRPSRRGLRAREDCLAARQGAPPGRPQLVARAAALRPVLGLYRAYVASRSRHRTDYRLQNAEGVSTGQLFYVYYAASLCRAGAAGDAQGAVNWPLMDEPDFEEAFGCSRGSAMNPADKCGFW